MIRKDILYKALKRLEKHLPANADAMLNAYEQYEEDHNTSYVLMKEAGELVYCLFSYPLLYADGSDEKKFDLNASWCGEEMILLVFNPADEIIADIAGIHMSAEDWLVREDLYDLVTMDSDWQYLAWYTLAGMCFDEVSFPLCLCDPAEIEEAKKQYPQLFAGEVLMHTNSYVTRRDRGQHIFTHMVQMMKEHALRSVNENTWFSATFCLDPDVACYGPDTVSWPYHYSFERDEPVRMHNKEILEHLGYTVVRLQEEEEDPDADGTKLWFAVHREYNVLLDEYENDIS